MHNHGKSSDFANKRKTAPRCAEVGGLPLIEPRGDELDVAVVHIAAHIEFERLRRRSLQAYLALIRQRHPLRHVVRLHDLLEHPLGEPVAAIRALAAIAAYRLEEALLALRPPLRGVLPTHHPGLRNTPKKHIDTRPRH